MEGELKLQCVSTALLSSGSADKVGEQEEKLKALVWNSAKAQVGELPTINVQALRLSLIGTLRDGVSE